MASEQKIVGYTTGVYDMLHIGHLNVIKRAKEQCETKEIVLGNISDAELLANNLAENCIPHNIDTMDVSFYDEFLLERRKMMAALIERYYKGL